MSIFATTVDSTAVANNNMLSTSYPSSKIERNLGCSTKLILTHTHSFPWQTPQWRMSFLSALLLLLSAVVSAAFFPFPEKCVYLTPYNHDSAFLVFAKLLIFHKIPGKRQMLFTKFQMFSIRYFTKFRKCRRIPHRFLPSFYLS